MGQQLRGGRAVNQVMASLGHFFFVLVLVIVKGIKGVVSNIAYEQEHH
jgi:hypothetical protein